MKIKKLPKPVKWLKLPESHDYPAALSYLNLIYTFENAMLLTEQLKLERMTSFKAKDIFRASQLSLLGISNSHVKKNLKKIKNGEKLSPLLLVRDTENGKVVIADGYHRLCAVYVHHEDAEIPCKIK